MPNETEPSIHPLATASVSRLWIEGTLFTVAAWCSLLQADKQFAATGHIDIRTLVGLAGVTCTSILSYINRNAARHSDAKQDASTPDA